MYITLSYKNAATYEYSRWLERIAKYGEVMISTKNHTVWSHRVLNHEVLAICPGKNFGDTKHIDIMAHYTDVGPGWVFSAYNVALQYTFNDWWSFGSSYLSITEVMGDFSANKYVIGDDETYIQFARRIADTAGIPYEEDMADKKFVELFPEWFREEIGGLPDFRAVPGKCRTDMAYDMAEFCLAYMQAKKGEDYANDLRMRLYEWEDQNRK